MFKCDIDLIFQTVRGFTHSASSVLERRHMQIACHALKVIFYIMETAMVNTCVHKDKSNIRLIWGQITITTSINMILILRLTLRRLCTLKFLKDSLYRCRRKPDKNMLFFFIDHYCVKNSFLSHDLYQKV